MNDLTLYKNIASAQDCVDQIQRLGDAWGKSGVFGTTRAEQGVVLLTICMTEGMTPTEVNRKYHIMNGMLSRKAGSALAEFKKMGGKYKWIVDGMGHYENPLERYAECWFKLDDQEYTIRFSMQDAVNAGYVRDGSNWTKEPWKNLRARVITNALGMIAPEIFFGDEVEDDSGNEYSNQQSQTSFLKSAQVEVEEPKQETSTPTNPKKVENEQPQSKVEYEIRDAEIFEPSRKTVSDGGDQSGGTKTTRSDANRANSKHLPKPGQMAAGRPAPKKEAPTESEAKPQSSSVDDAKPEPQKQRDDPKLNDLQKQVAQIVGDDAERALNYVRQELGWDKEHKGFAGLTDAECNQIISYSEDFMSTIKTSS